MRPPLCQGWSEIVSMLGPLGRSTAIIRAFYPQTDPHNKKRPFPVSPLKIINEKMSENFLSSSPVTGTTYSIILIYNMKINLLKVLNC
jgi:hypothetical protein